MKTSAAYDHANDAQKFVMEQMHLLGVYPTDVAQTLHIRTDRLVMWLEGTLPTLDDAEWEALDKFFMRKEV